ncbi:LINE-1 type transposase domain containing protein 1 [Dissostichus eleginoides]|uniref:LINE-1 type transposase domain containing protein 1 n=1 Tax=Dissostichus eleginoides TaxID=100907 RepID=A0AAD9BL40_DISEL|nr:LINE-1 type transposase domain containing protein 1 [Dissostichus eleginoides]
MAAVETGEKILAAIGSLKSDFSTRLDGILTAIEGVRKEGQDGCNEGSQGKKQILYKDQQVRSYPDLAAGVHKQQKTFNNVRQKLRNLGIRYGMLLPARLLVTYKDKSHTFENPSAVENFIKQITREEGQAE